METGLDEMIYQKTVKKNALYFFIFQVGDIDHLAIFSNFKTNQHITNVFPQ